jgi:two-component system, NarL family, nitrate/nitrite response regulator NarL
MVTRLALVDDHPTLLKGLAEMFADDPTCEVVATGGAADDAILIVRDQAPDLIVLDLSMPGDVFAAIAEMARTAPQLKVVVFTAFSNVDMALKAMDAGAHAFVLKGSPTNDLFDAIDAVRRGEIYVSPEFSHQLLNGLKNRTRQLSSSAVNLTARERQLVRGLLQARSNFEIASDLGLTEKLVGHYMTGLMAKLRARNRLEILQALERLNLEGL